MRHGRWEHKGQRRREGGRRRKGEEKTAEVRHLSRKHVLLYYRCGIMCYSSYMVANATFVRSNQLSKQKQHNLGGILREKLQTCQVNSKGYCECYHYYLI